MRVGERRAVGGTEITLLAVAEDGRVTLRIGPAGRCERRVTLAAGERVTAGGVTLLVGPGTTADQAEVLPA